MENNRLFELADELKALRERKDALEAELKQINRKIYFVDADLSDLMGTTGTQNFTRDGTMFFLTTKVHASARAGMKERRGRGRSDADHAGRMVRGASPGAGAAV